MKKVIFFATVILCLAFLCACGETATPNEDTTASVPALEYQIAKDGSGYIIEGMGECSDRQLIIPETYKGLPVIEIADNAFSGYTFITEVIIPSGVTSIGSGAFGWCTGLTSVTIPSSVTSVGWSIFDECSESLIVYVEAASRPSGWHERWHGPGTVVWDYKNQMQ